MSKNGQQLPEANINTGSGMSVPGNIYHHHANRQEDCKQMPTNLNIASAALSQESNLQPALTKTGATNQNNCYVVYISLASNGQVIVPLMTDANSGVRMLPRFPHQSNTKVLPSTVAANLPVRISSSAVPMVASSACSNPTDGMAGQLEDKSKLPVAVVLPYSNAANNCRNDGSQLTREPLQNQQNTQNVPSIMICQPGNGQQLSTQPSSCPDVAGQQKSPPQQNHAHSIVASPGLINAALSHRGSRPLTMHPPNQQLIQQQQQQQNSNMMILRQLNSPQLDLRLQLGSQQQGMQGQQFHKDQFNQFIGNRLLGQSELVQQKALQQLALQSNGLQHPRVERTSCSQVRPPQDNRQSLPSSDQHLPLPVQSAVSQQLSALRISNPALFAQHNVNQLAVQQKSLQQSAQQQDGSQILMNQRQPQLHLGMMPTLISSQGLPSQIIVQPGDSQQLIRQNKSNQPFALLVNNYRHPNAGPGMLSQGIDLQQGNCQLMDLQQQQQQQRIFPQGCNTSQLDSKHFNPSCLTSKLTHMISDLRNQLPNGGCLQLGNKQELFKQQQQQQHHQLLQQQQQQQQQLRLGDAVHGSLLAADEKSRQDSCDSKSVLPSHFAPVQHSKSGAVVTGNEKYLDLGRSSDASFTGVGVSLGKGPSDTEGTKSFPNQQLHLFNQCLNNAAVLRQSLCATSANHSALNNLQFSTASCPGAAAGSHNQFAVSVTKQSAHPHGYAVASSASDVNSSNIGKNITVDSKGPSVCNPQRFPFPIDSVGKGFSHLGSASVGASLSNMAASNSSRQNSTVVQNQASEQCVRNPLVVSQSSAHNSASSSGNFVPHNNICLPSTVVHLRMAMPPGKSSENTSSTGPQVSRSEQTFLQNYSNVGLASLPQSYLQHHVLPGPSNSSLSVADQSGGCQRLTSASFASPGFNNLSSATSKVELSSISATNSGKIPELPAKLTSTPTIFFKVMHSESNVTSVSSTDLMSPTQQLEKGQECELRYCTGQRLKATWDGKYFKVKNPSASSNQDSDSINVASSYHSSVKGGGIILKEGLVNASSESAPMLRTSVSNSEVAHEPVVSVSASVQLARPPLHQGTDVLSKPTATDVTFVSAALSSVLSAPTAPLVMKRPREEGKFAVCTHCGAFSCDYDRCDQCRRVLPPDVKLYDPKRPKTDATVHSPVATPPCTESSARKPPIRKSGDLVLGAKRPASEMDSKLSPRSHHPLKISPASLKQKPTPKVLRKQEAEIVHILSSDEEDEDPLGKRNSQNAQTSVAAQVPSKAKKFKGESVSANANNQAIARGQPPTTEPEGDGSRLQKSQSFIKSSEPLILTADVVRAFFGFIHHGMKCCLILKQNMMMLQPINTNDGSLVTINASDIQMVAGHINQAKCLYCLFVLISPGKAGDLRKGFQQNDDSNFNPVSNEDCKKYIVLFLGEQSADFLSNVEHIVNGMHDASGVSKPQYKRIENFDVEKYLQAVCPNEELQNFTQASNKSGDALLGGSQNLGNAQKGPENEDDEADYGSRSPSPVHALFSGQIIKFFTYPPPPAMGGITVTNEDLFCLNEGEFLNDVIIDFFLKYLATELLSDRFQRTHIFSSFFYRRLTQKPSRRHKEEEESECASIQQRRHSRIRTWTRHVDIFEKDFLIVPINESAHWYLAIICYPGLTSPEVGCRGQPELADDATETDPKRTKTKGKIDSPEKPEAACANRKGKAKGKKAIPAKLKTEQCIKKMPCILVFDSLAGPGRNGVIRILREYLQVEWDVKKKETLGSRVFTKENMKGTSPECPQQSNFSDCGIYVLQYVESFFTDPIEDFTFPLKLVGKWFNEEKVKTKRRDLQTLILELMKKFNPSLDYSPENDGCLVKLEPEELTGKPETSSQPAAV